MSAFTVPLKVICESMIETPVTGTSAARKVDNVIGQARGKIFDFDYPIFDESYREHLEKKIIRHYYFREIATETFGMWQVQLCDRMNEIMPYFNQLYNSETMVINPLLSFKETGRTDTTDNKTSKVQDSGNDNDVYGDSVSNTVDKSSTNSGNDREIYGDTVTSNYGKRVVNGGNDTTTDTPGVSDTQTRTPNLTHSKTGTDSNSATHTQTADSTHGQTDWNIVSDTPQGGLNNITGGNSPVTTPGIPQGGTMYASQITEHTTKSVDNSGATSDSNSMTYNTQDVDTGTETVQTSHTGQNVVRLDYGQTVQDSGNNSQAHTGDLTHQYGHVVTDHETDVQSHTGNITHNYGKIVDSTDNNIGAVLSSREGFSNGQNLLLKEYRDNMLNIDKQVIDSLNDLFFGLYNF